MSNSRAEYQRSLRRYNATRAVPEHVHGTTGGYTNYACRCDRCRAAQSKATSRRDLKAYIARLEAVIQGAGLPLPDRDGAE